MTTILQAYTKACDFPGTLDEHAVTRALRDYCAALGISRKIIRLRAGWSLNDHPALSTYVSLILDDAAKRGGWAASDARAASDASAARDARDASDASDARDASDASDARAARDAWDARDASDASAARDARDASRLSLNRFAAWCVNRAGWWYVGDLSWLTVTHVGAVQLKKSSVTKWSKRVFDAYAAGCWMVVWTPDALFWIAKPLVHTEPRPNTRRRLHCHDGPAVESDLENLYFWHGVLVPAYAVTRPDWITVKEIERERNAELRRVLIERYKGGREKGGGAAAYLADSGAKVIHEDLDLLGASRRLIWKDVEGDEPIVMIDVQNSTPEPDGSIKRYQLRVDPRQYEGRSGKECLAAIASTWRCEDGSLLFPKPEDYAPMMET